MAGRRWDGDERGEGVADATAFLPGATELLDAMRLGRWVAEEPEAHLLPHLLQACDSLPFELVDSRSAPDGSFDVELRWTGEAGSIGAVREAIFELLGSFAESATYVRQRREASESGLPILYEVVTGMLGSDLQFATHGHTLRLTVAGVDGR